MKIFTGCRGTVPLILHLSPGWSWVGHFGEQTNLLPLPEFKTQALLPVA